MKRRLILASFLSSALPGQDTLHGRWRSVTTTKGGIGAVYVFKPGGVVRYSSAVLLEMPFRREGQILSLGDQVVGTGWHPDGRLQLNYGNGILEDYTRVGKPSNQAEPLVGEWLGTRELSGRMLSSHYLFSQDGKATVYLDLRTLTGRYQPLPKRGWRMTLPSLPPRTILATGDEITIQLDGGDVHTFRRL